MHCLILGVQCAARSGASLHPAQDLDAEIDLIMDQLQQGTVEDRGSAAEKLFNKAAEDEAARQKAAAAGVIQPLVWGDLHFCTIMSSLSRL